MPKHGKKYLEAGKKVESDRLYAPDEAVSVLRDISFANFDETIEVHARLGIDPRQADQTVRSTVVLPHGTGKSVRVLVFAAGEAERVARESGADYAGVDDLVQQIQGGWLEFDAFGASRLRSLQRVDKREQVAPNLVIGKALAPDTEVDDAGAVIAELDATALELREDSGKIADIAHYRARARIWHQTAAPQDAAEPADLAHLVGHGYRGVEL
jgi:large subunit ribosomal protein L1